jgi:hypothetical protein
MQFTRSIAALTALALAFCSTVAVAHGPIGQRTQAVAELAATKVEAFTGTVHELIVDDTTRGTSQRYIELELADGSLVALQGDAAQSLPRDATVEVRGRRSGNALDVETSRALPRTAAPNAKALTEIDGTLAILHADNFADGRSSFVYEVHHASGNVHELRLAVTPSMLEPGMQVRVQGRASADGASMTPDRITILSRQASETAAVVAKAATANSVLVIMANFNNTVAPGFSAAQVQQVMTTNGDSVANFFRETSYGQQLMNVTATPGWVTLNMAQPTTCGTTDWRNIGTSAEAAAKALGSAYDPAAYNFVVYVFPVSSCGWSGLAYIGSPHKAWINGTGSFSTATIAHEMGHNFGLLHAASLRCTTAIGGTCSSSEYGDPFDAMGNQRAMHYNAMQKAKLAWIPSTSVKTHAGGSATYTLSPLETGGAATYAVKIPTAASNRTYWLEFRQPIGFDSPLAAFNSNGAQIRVSYPFETMCSGCTSNSDDTELLDMTPSTTSFNDATLPVGQTFSDPTYGINVTVLSASASALTVQVGTGGAAPPVPPPPAPTATTTSIVATPNPSKAGALVTITASVSGNAPTGSMTFVDNGIAIAGCSGLSLAGSGNVRSASCSTNAFLAGNHSIVSSYGGDTVNLASTSSYTEVVNSPVNGTNVALAVNGAVATASSTNGPGFMPSTVIDNKRTGAGWGAGGGWNDATAGTFPDWIQINFAGVQAIDHVVVYFVQDNYLNPVEPTDSMKFSLRGITSFQVQGFDGANWVTLATVNGNDLVKRTVSFAPYRTDRIRINILGALSTWSRVTEVEAWTSTAAAQETNFALAANGSVATASSTNGTGFLASTVIDDRRSGAGWGAGGGWNDATAEVFPTG